jgi:hypothetical protein
MGSNKPRDPEWVARFERLSPPLPRGKLWRLLGNPRDDAEAVKQIKRRESSEVDRQNPPHDGRREVREAAPEHKRDGEQRPFINREGRQEGGGRGGPAALRNSVFHLLRGKGRGERHSAKRGAPGESARIQRIMMDRETGDLIGEPDRANKCESVAAAERQRGNGCEGGERYGARKTKTKDETRQNKQSDPERAAPRGAKRYICHLLSRPNRPRSCLSRGS